MHSTTTSPTRTPQRLVFLTLLAALLLLALAQAAPVLAAGNFNGGVNYAGNSDTSTMVANDHTVYVTRITAAAAGGLAADTTYYVKLRFTPNADGSPAGTNNRGFTWNATSKTWAQEREDWTSFPTITTAADGSIAASDATWLFYKFGDTTKTGTYYLMASLSTGASGSTLNGTALVAVTVLDQTTTGAWVHDGKDTTQTIARTASVRLPTTGSSTPPVARQRSEPNLCDDDDDGIVDNEQYGPVATGTFRMAVPTTSTDTYQVYLPGNSTKWPDATGFMISIPDTDVALGATDQVAPGAPTAPSAKWWPESVEIMWSAATDDVGVAGYSVYRWTDAPLGAGYSPTPVKVGAVTTGTSFVDSGASLVRGTTYHYFVRAYDAATNVGPRSATVEVTPIYSTQLLVDPSPVIVDWGKPWALGGWLRVEPGHGVVPDANVKVMQSLDGGLTWALVKTITPATGTSTYTDSIAAPTQKSKYELVYDGTSAYAAATSSPVTVTPRVKLGHPVAPSTVKKKKSFTVYGSLTPKASAGSKTVKIKCYVKKSGKWVLKKTVTAKNANKGSASQYKASTSLPSKGSWKLVASAAATSKYAATTSSPECLKVK